VNDPQHLAVFLVEATGRLSDPAMDLVNTGKASWNNVPNKTLLVGTFLCAVLGTLRSRFCVPDTVLDVPDIIWNILPNNIRYIFLISDL
jgi:hypothetical protein